MIIDSAIRVAKAWGNVTIKTAKTNNQYLHKMFSYLKEQNAANAKKVYSKSKTLSTYNKILFFLNYEIKRLSIKFISMIENITTQTIRHNIMRCVFLSCI